jgi:signal transduction histidine kinase
MTPPRCPIPLLARLWLLAALCVMLVVPTTADAQGDAASAPARGRGETAQVLVITGSDPYLPAFVAIDAAMRAAVVQRHQRSVVWLHESIDTVRLGGSAGSELANLLARKYAGVRVDSVVLVTEPAVDFFLRYRDRLWPNVPAVYNFVLPRFASQLPPDAGLSGIPAEIDFPAMLRIAFALQPKARRVVVVGGVSLFDEMQLAGARAALLPYGDRVQVEFIVGLSPQATAERLARETLDTIVLYMSLFRDADGHVYLPRDVLQRLSAASGAPVYGVFDSYMGYGLAAGAMESFSERGERVADLVVRALDGLPAGATGIEPAPPSKCLADGRQLQRFGLDAQALPAGCEVRFVEASFLQRYWWQSVGVVLALAAQSALIAALLLHRRRRRAAELSLQTQRAQLLHASRLAVAGELTASIAHEINQPLAAILSNAEAAETMLEAGRLPRDELVQILGDIRRDDLRASEVIKRLRTLLAGHDVQRRRFSLNDAVGDTAALLRAEARRRAVALEDALLAQRAEVLGDPVQIQQVIINLCLNAFDASEKVPQDRRRVRIETSDTPRGVQLSVRDFGTGITEADLPRVFDSFFSTKRGGMGLGLAIARTIVEAHGGTIEAAACDVGTEFRILLPTAPASDTPEPPETNAP